jgi:aspartyl-tRNA(Asn)/glutamyl-tRNA(Gln) amidotransferase subunit A
MANELCWMTVTELAHGMRAGAFSPVEVTQAHLERIAALNPQLEAYLTITAEHALTAAARAEAELRSGCDRGPLHGVPYSLKDVFATQGVRTTAGSAILADWVPDEDAAAKVCMDAAGAVMLGKVNTHEFAFGATTQNIHARTKNPWDRTRIPGGSSGGSGAAVAAGLSTVSLGTDTGGSVRCPALFNGIVGLKPTYGRVSCHGVVSQSWTVDHVGPLTRSVADAAAVLQVVAGFDSRDHFSSRAPVPDFSHGLGKSVRGLKVGIPCELMEHPLEPAVEAAFSAARATFTELGAIVKDISVPRLATAADVSLDIVMPETTARHAEWLNTRPQDYGADVLELLEQGRVLAPNYIRANRLRQQLRFDLELTLHDEVDLLLTPGAPSVAPRIGQPTIQLGGEDVDFLTALIRFLSPFSLTGLPALTVPAGFDDQSLPVGIQLIGSSFDEVTVLQAGDAFEQATKWSQCHPTLD